MKNNYTTHNPISSTTNSNRNQFVLGLVLLVLGVSFGVLFLAEISQRKQCQQQRKSLLHNMNPKKGQN